MAGLTAARTIKLDPIPTRPSPVVHDGGHLTRPHMNTTIIDGPAVDSDDDAASISSSSSTMSPLSLRINSSVNICKGNNLVCLTDSPARYASAIAEAVTRAIHETSSATCGIPMVDGDGNPRPIHIDVDAGLTVDGVGNVVGSEDMVREVLRQRGEQLRRRRQDDDASAEAEAYHAKRRRSE